MPIPGIALTSSDGFTGPQKHTRFAGPVIVGQVSDNGSSGPLYSPGGVLCIQSTANLTNQVVSTAAIARGAYIYIPVTTGPMISGTAPPYVGAGTPLVWDDTNKRLNVWSSGSASWMAQLSSVGGGYFTTS